MTDLTPAATAPVTPALAATFDATVAWLRDRHHAAILAHALQVGRYLLDTYYAGDVARFHDGSPTGHASFEALLVHRREALADLGLSGSTLRNYIRAWEVWSDLPETVRARLELSHLVALARVEPITRSQLAFQAAQDGWPVRQLDEAVESWLLSLRTPGRGRPPLPKPVKAWGEVFSATRRARKLAAQLDDLAPKHRQHLEREMEAAVAELQTALAALRGKDE